MKLMTNYDGWMIQYLWIECTRTYWNKIRIILFMFFSLIGSHALYVNSSLALKFIHRSLFTAEWFALDWNHKTRYTVTSGQWILCCFSVFSFYNTEFSGTHTPFFFLSHLKREAVFCSCVAATLFLWLVQSHTMAENSVQWIESLRCIWLMIDVVVFWFHSNEHMHHQHS